jgi:hypothetical protein
MLACLMALLSRLCRREESALPADFGLMAHVWYFDCVRPYRAHAGELAT